MHKSLIVCALCAFFIQNAFAQNSPDFKAVASQTEVLLGNYIEVEFVLENSRGGKFFAPDFEAAGFLVRGGPNQSSNFSMVNGETKSTISYGYFVEPRDTGSLFIPEAIIKNGQETYKTEPLTIQVFANPEGIIETPQPNEQLDIWGRPRPAPIPEPSVEPKKKRKTTRI